MILIVVIGFKVRMENFFEDGKIKELILNLIFVSLIPSTKFYYCKSNNIYPVIISPLIRRTNG